MKKTELLKQQQNPGILSCFGIEPKVRNHSCALILFLIFLAIAVSGCQKSDILNQNMKHRHFVIYASDVTKPLPDIRQIKPETQVINGVSTQVTRFLFSPEDIQRSAGMAQVLDINKNTRLLGFEFDIRSLSGPCSIIPVIISTDPNYNNFVTREQIHLDGIKWNHVSLTFREFTDTRSRMHLDIDSLFPGHYNTIELILIPSESNGMDKVLEWGPLSGIYEKNRYRFH